MTMGSIFVLSAFANNFRIMICCAEEDKQEAQHLYRKLTSNGFYPWLASEDVFPGQTWSLETRNIMSECMAIIICLSSKSVTKSGLLHKEIKYAIDVADEKPEGSIFLIPLRLEPCLLPKSLEHIQAVDLFREGGYDKLLSALGYQLGYKGSASLLSFVDNLVDIKGVKVINFAQRTELVENLLKQLEEYVVRQMFDTLSDKDMDILSSMLDEKTDSLDINKFIFDHTPDAPQIFLAALERFKRDYLAI